MRHWKQIVSVLCLVCMTLLLTMPAAALSSKDAAHAYPIHKDNCGLYDVEGNLPENEAAELTQKIRDTAEELQMYVAVVIVGKETPFSGDSAVERYADDAYDELFNQEYGVNTDGVLLVVNNSTQYGYISTCGMGQFYYTNSDDSNRVDDMLVAMHSALVAGDYPQVVEQFCQQLVQYKNQGVPKGYYTYNSGSKTYMYLDDNGKLIEADRLPFKWGWWIFIASIVGAGVALVVYFSIKSQYKFKTTPSPTTYVCHNKVKMDVQTDTFLREYTTKTKIETSSGGGGGRSGGGSSHHSSGGSSHGGGGRHR